MTEEKDSYFYCYNRKVSEYLWNKGIKYITIAINPKDKRTYSMYKIDSSLKKALEEYKQNKN